MKRTITATIDEDVHEEAKKRGLNVSAIMSKALYEQTFGMQTATISLHDSCQLCRKVGERETKEDVKRFGHYSKPDKLTWLYPDEIWVCNDCLKILVSKVPMAGGVHQ